MSIVRHFVIETREVESIEDEVFLHLAEVLIALRREKPKYPLGKVALLVISLTIQGNHVRSCDFVSIERYERGAESLLGIVRIRSS